jgi:glycosyltransferase involved in cell wall biosynthesis/SAM-dependent methyltransferase
MVDHLLSGFTERGHDVALVCGGPVSDHEYEVINSGGTYTQYLAAPIICLTRFRDADVIIDVENGIPFFSPLWRRRPSICLVHHVHTDQWHLRFPGPIAAVCRTFERRVMPAIYRNWTFVAISNSTAAELRAIGVPGDHIRVIEAGVDIPPGTPADKSAEPLFISLNRLVPHKRVDLLLDAWQQASKEIPGRLLIVGDGPELANLRSQAQDIERVEFLGRVSEEVKYDLLAKAWIVLSAAHHEGWGMSIMEGATMGTPTLAVEAPGVRDAVVEGVTGVLVKAPENVLPAALAKAWVDLSSDPQLRERLGSAAQRRATDYSWGRAVDKWLVVFDEVAATASRTRRTRSLATAISAASGALGPVKSTRASTKPQAGSIGGLRRSIRLLKGFRTQYDDPDGFYTMLADDTVELVADYHPVNGQRVVDVGGGPGYFAQAFRRAGAESVFVEPFWESMTSPGRQLGYGVIADGLKLPFSDGTFDISHSSNVIEHVVQPEVFFDEMLRVVRPGGLMFLAFTNWFSPFGGHETSPWHYLGGRRAAERYERKLGHPPKNNYGSSLFRLDIADVLKWSRTRREAQLIDTFPRYYPAWTKPVVAIPGIRELVTWNLVVVLRRN